MDAEYLRKQELEEIEARKRAPRARKLVLEKKADFLGTDAHRTCHRPPSAERDYAEVIAWGNAQKFLCV